MVHKEPVKIWDVGVDNTVISNWLILTIILSIWLDI